MISMTKIKKNDIPVQLYHSMVVLYGAGTTGRRIINMLSPYQIHVKYIVDDDMHRWGTKIENIEIISYQRLKELCDDVKDISVILTTIYGKAVLERVSKIPQIKVYEMYEWLDEVYGIDSWVKKIQKDEIGQFGKNCSLIRHKLADEESIKVLEGICACISSLDMNIFSEICTKYTQYFIPEVLEAVRTPLELVDGGAYIGELYQAIMSYNLELGHWYCFEADEDNYNQLLHQSEKANLSGKQICVKKGLWDKEGILYFDGEKDTASKIVDYKTNHQITTISLDTYFSDKKCNFIKMDIEGAEYPALCGGIRLIKRDRPILAISIYHSLDDFFRIPYYLMEQLDCYHYYIRHHALTFSETVLYAIPDELVIRLNGRGIYGGEEK